jgi:hypothetical protein
MQEEKNVRRGEKVTHSSVHTVHQNARGYVCVCVCVGGEGGVSPEAWEKAWR